MGTIDSLKSMLTQPSLDALCENYHIPDAVHPQLPEMDLFAFIRHADPTKVKGAGNEGVNDVAEASQAERGDRVVDIGGIEIVANDEIQAIVANQPKKIKKKRKVTDGLLERSTLATEVGVTAAATVPFVTSFVTPTPEHDGGGGGDSTAGPIIRTRPAPERFVVLTDSSHYSGTSVVDEKVTSIVRSFVPPPLVLIVAVTTTVSPGATFVPVHNLGVGQVNPSIFRDSASPTMTEADVEGPSQHVGTDLSAGSFYISQDMDAKTLRQVDRLKERDIEIASLKAQLSLKEAEAAKAIRLRGQIAAVEAAKATKITELNSLRERNISLEGQVAALESTVVSKDAEIASSQSQVAKLTHDLSSLQLSCDELSMKASSLESEKDKLVDKVSGLEDEQMRVLSNRVVAIDSGLMEMVLHMDTAFYPCYLTTIAGRRWILSHGLRLVFAKCLASPKYLSAMGEVIGRSIDKGMQDGLTVGIEHGRAGRSIADVVAFNPFAEGDYVDAINALRDVNFLLLAQLEANKDSSMADIMDLLRLEGPTAEAFEASQLQPSPEQLMVEHNRVQRVRGDATARRLSLTDSILPLVEPFTARNLTGEASSFAALATAVTTAISTTFAQTDPVLSVLSTEVHPSPNIIFEDEELDTTLKHVLAQ
uniref:Transposase (Putative), gypsy type n=1 Tax=Tanacetum cinerariifolium TaxID=118510 RepID=A0A6L2JII3_TANCI|nr:hypothetical protein [Tanacetum cinerariifolium]